MLNNIKGVYSPNDIKTNIISVGELNNKLGNNLALLKIIDVKTSYNSSIFNNGDGTIKELETKTKLLVKVLTAKETVFLEITEDLNYNNYNPLDVNLYEILIKRNAKAKNKSYVSYNPKNPRIMAYLAENNWKKDNKLINRFNRLYGVEFLVNGLGVPLDEDYNKLSGLILLDGVLTDYLR